MKILVIPDVHLKPWMFASAASLMEQGVAEMAVCLGDLADDWGCEHQVQLYEQTYDAAISFARTYPTTKWCWGNHDLSYWMTTSAWQVPESGYSRFASNTVRSKLLELRRVLGDNPIAYIHRVDNVLFSHAGLSASFARSRMERIHPETDIDDVDAVIEAVNDLGPKELWCNGSPIWLRPSDFDRLYHADTVLQVVGHTPVEQPYEEEGALYTDTFSTYRDGRPYGSQEFLLVDSETWEWRGIPAER